MRRFGAGQTGPKISKNMVMVAGLLGHLLLGHLWSLWTSLWRERGLEKEQVNEDDDLILWAARPNNNWIGRV